MTPERAQGFERELAATVDDHRAACASAASACCRAATTASVYTPHGTYARDLWLFVKILGYSPMETLVAATRLGGEIMGLPGELGSSSRAPSPICCWWTAIRSPTSRSCRTAARSA